MNSKSIVPLELISHYKTKPQYSYNNQDQSQWKIELPQYYKAKSFLTKLDSEECKENYVQLKSF